MRVVTVPGGGVRPFFARAGRPLALLASAILCAVPTLRGSMDGTKELVIDFTSPDAASRATWFLPGIITANAFGLGWDGEATSTREGWFLTEPVAIGYSWRPAVSASLTARLAPPAPDAALPNDLYVRYGADAKNWSSWQPLQADEALYRQKGERVFRGAVAAPNYARIAYTKLLADYQKLDVPWASDEDAAVRWIVSRNPRFFETELPFVGYVQFLYEGRFPGGRRLAKFSVRVGWGLSGVHIPAKDPSARPDPNAPWKYKATDLP